MPAFCAAYRADADELLGRPRLPRAGGKVPTPAAAWLGEKWRGNVGIFCRYEICVSGVRLMGLKETKKERGRERIS